jgi:hypothetical protein
MAVHNNKKNHKCTLCDYMTTTKKHKRQQLCIFQTLGFKLRLTNGPNPGLKTGSYFYPYPPPMPPKSQPKSMYGETYFAHNGGKTQIE